MLRWLLLFTVTALCAFAVFAQSPADETSVISATLFRLVAVNRPDLRAGFLIAPETTTDLASEASDPPPIKGLDDAWSDYRTRNRQSVALPNDLPKAAIVARTLRDYAITTAVVSISRPGFQDGGNAAVVRCDVTPASGPVTQMVYVFKRTRQGWVSSGSYFPVGQKDASPN
jgi:hypothetical protein